MTAITTSALQQLTGSAQAALPRVNLLPPEIGERRRFKRLQVALGGGVLATVGAVALMFVAATGSVHAAQGDLGTASAHGSQLTAETAKYSDVTAVYAQAAAAEAMLTEAMGQEVRYSRFLSDLSLSVPQNVWLTSLQFAQGAVDPSLGTTEPGVGSLSVQGRGYSHEDVALWLESLAGQESYANPYFSASEEKPEGPRTLVHFTSTAAMTPKALSGRYTQPAGG